MCGKGIKSCFSQFHRQRNVLIRYTYNVLWCVKTDICKEKRQEQKWRKAEMKSLLQLCQHSQRSCNIACVYVYNNNRAWKWWHSNCVKIFRFNYIYMQNKCKYVYKIYICIQFTKYLMKLSRPQIFIFVGDKPLLWAYFVRFIVGCLT